ncbi:MAG TPA: hypothetical protein VLE73_07020 [Candidatus Saccharimonadales bacterium]|nr:hypothetical protein [Candidatus Saccharimonadales bacterium]
MRIPRSIRYVTAMDILDAGRMREAAIHMSYGINPNEALPFDSGLRAAVEIYGTRLACIAKGTGAIACRLSGIDAMYRIATNTDFPV